MVVLGGGGGVVVALLSCGGRVVGAGVVVGSLNVSQFSMFLNYSFFSFHFSPVKPKLKLQRRGSPGELYSQKTKSVEGNFYFNSE